MVDDDRDFQTIVRGWLAPRYDVSSLSSGEGLLDELSEAKPDLLILDVRMPGPSGFDLCAKIRADTRFAEIPILFLTGCREDEDFIKNLDAGGTAFLTKPVERRKLLAMVRELVASSGVV